MMNRRILAGALCAMLLLATSCGQDTPPASSDGITMDSTSTGSEAITTAESSMDGSTTSSGSGSTEESGSGTTRSQTGGKTGSTQKTNGGQPTKTVTTTTTKTTGKSTPVAVEKTLKPLTASDESQFWGNPDRGFRSELSVDLAVLSEQQDKESYCKTRILTALAQHRDHPGDVIVVVQTYLYLTAYKDGDIPAKGLDALKTYLRVLKEMGIKCQPRFLYMTMMPDPENEAKQEIILRHIDQLAPVIKEFKDVIQAFPICFIGAFGEWHSDGLKYEVDKKAVCKAVMEKLVVPNGLYGLIRLPEYKNLMKGESWYNRLGVENDAVFGKVPYGYGNADAGTGGLEDGNEQWLQLTREAAYTPQDGETYWNDWLKENDAWIDGLRCVLQFSEHRFTTLSIKHCYLDWGRDEKAEIGKWKKLPVTEDWLKQNKILYDADWFKDKNGKVVSRNVFEFVRDHLGYRVVGKNLKVTGNSKPSANIQVDMTIENRGFSAAFNLESGFAILDANNKVVSTVKCGNPETWYNRNPDNYNDGKQLSHKLSTKIQLPKKAGHYKLAFYLKNTLNRYARISIDTNVVNGYHVLHEFDIA